MARKARNPDTRFAAVLTAAGAEMLSPTNAYEVMRFRTKHGVGVIYENAKGVRTWNAAAEAARAHLAAKRGSLAPVEVKGRRRDAATVRALLRRDGENCFFCRLPLGDDITVEHLVAVAHGGPNHISNLFLAHGGCNQRAGHLSAPEKITMRETWGEAE